MQGTAAGTASEPTDLSRRGLDFACRLLERPPAEHPSLEALLGELAAAFAAHAAGIASLTDGIPVARAQHTSSPTDKPSRWPWIDHPELLTRVRQAKHAVAAVLPDGGQLWLTVAAPPGETGWLIWLETANADRWPAAGAAALAIAGQALARWLPAAGAMPRWVEQLERAARQQRLEAAADVARRLAHDFGNVLTGILGFSELALAQSTEPAAVLHRYLEEVYRSAQNGAQFTHQLRLFSRRHPVSPKPCALAAALREEETRIRAQGGDIPFHATLPADLPLLAIDAEHLQQVLAALLDNARDAAGPAGSVRISARTAFLTTADCLDRFGDLRPGEHVEIAIADDGPGLTPEARQRLFADPFFTTRPRRRGLGLATAYGILHAHRGGLRLANGPNGGVLAEISVPIGEPAPRAVAQPAAGGERVLVVDDEPAIVQFVTKSLEHAGYRVQTALGGREALASYAATANDPYRLVVSDVLMPEITGVDLARRLLAHDPQVRVLFMSGHVGGDFPRRDFAGQQFELIDKPFRTDVLLRAVRQALDRGPAASAAGRAAEGRTNSTSR